MGRRSRMARGRPRKPTNLGAPLVPQVGAVAPPPKELNKLVDDTRHSNKQWSTDHSAIVLEISVRNRTKHKLWHLGADDDPNHEIRRGITRAKAAERVRKFRAKHSTGTAKRGRPALELSPEAKLARRRAQDAERARRCRASRKKVLRHIKNSNTVTELSVTPRPCAMISPAVTDLKLFGITAIRVMHGTDVVRAWVMR